MAKPSIILGIKDSLSFPASGEIRFHRFREGFLLQNIRIFLICVSAQGPYPGLLPPHGSVRLLHPEKAPEILRCTKKWHPMGCRFLFFTGCLQKAGMGKHMVGEQIVCKDFRGRGAPVVNPFCDGADPGIGYKVDGKPFLLRQGAAAHPLNCQRLRDTAVGRVHVGKQGVLRHILKCLAVKGLPPLQTAQQKFCLLPAGGIVRRQEGLLQVAFIDPCHEIVLVPEMVVKGLPVRAAEAAELQNPDFGQFLGLHGLQQRLGEHGLGPLLQHIPRLLCSIVSQNMRFVKYFDRNIKM